MGYGGRCYGDDKMVQLVETIENGMLEFRHEMSSSLREYFQFKDDLHSVDGVMYKNRIVIPPTLRKIYWVSFILYGKAYR